MTLKLTGSREAYQAFPSEGTAPNVEQMPLLIADKRVPMNVSQLMQRRLEVRDYADDMADVKSAWMDNYFDMGDGVAYHPDGRVKIVLDSEDLRKMTPDSPRNGGALILTPEAYDSLQCEEFQKGKLGKADEQMSREDVKAHPVWKTLARDQHLLNEYADYIFSEGKERFNYDNVMGVFPGTAGGKTPEMRAWCVSRLGFRSGVYGRDDLDDYYGRLVGLAPEAREIGGNDNSKVMADAE